MSTSRMDDLDRAIIHELEQDGRRSMRKIARNLDTPEATIRTRMKRLSDLGILRIVAFADPRELSQAQLALVQISVDPTRHNEIIEALVGMPETTYISTVLGDADIVAEVVCADNEELWEILNHRIANIPGVRDTTTHPVLKVHKLDYGARS